MTRARAPIDAVQGPDQGVRATLEAGMGFRMARAHRALRECWQERIADLGLSAPQGAMLRTICENPRSGLRELARRMRTDPMNAKRLADHLEQAGLVVSAADPAHRQRRELRATRDGVDLAARLARRSAAFDRQLSKDLGRAELEQLRELLTRLEDALGERQRGKGRP